MINHDEASRKAAQFTEHLKEEEVSLSDSTSILPKIGLAISAAALGTAVERMKLPPLNSNEVIQIFNVEEFVDFYNHKNVLKSVIFPIRFI